MLSQGPMKDFPKDAVFGLRVMHKCKLTTQFQAKDRQRL